MDYCEEINEAMKTNLHRALHHPLFLSLYFPSFLGFFAGGLLSPVTPLYMASFQVNYATIGLMLSMASVGKLVMDLPGGVIIPKLGIKKALAIGALIIGAANLAMYWSRFPYEIIIYQFFLGIGDAFYNTSRMGFAAAMTENEHRGRSLSLLGGMNRISRIFSPTLGGILAAAMSLRFVFLISGIIFLVETVVIIARMPKNFAQANPTHSDFGIMWQLVKEKANLLWRTGIGAMLLTTVRIARFTLIPLYAAEVLGLQADQVGLILSAASMADAFNMVTAGIIMDRFGRRFAAIPCVGLMAISMALIPFTTSFWGLLAVGVLAGLGNGFGSGIMMTMGADLAPADHRIEFLAVWHLILGVGSAACPLIVGAISDLLSLTMSGFAFFGLGILGVLAFIYLVPETNRPAGLQHQITS